MKIKFRLNKEKMIEVLSDLKKIKNKARLKINNEYTFIYSSLGEYTMLAMKSYNIPTPSIFDIDLNMEVDLIITNPDILIKNLKLMSDDIEGEFTINSTSNGLNCVTSFIVKSGKIKIKTPCGEQSLEQRDVNKQLIDKVSEPSLIKWGFSVEEDDFNTIKNLSKINPNKLININIIRGKVIMSEEDAWDLEIDTSINQGSLIMNKMFLACINKDSFRLNVYESFMLISDSETNLMLSFEQDFGDDEI